MSSRENNRARFPNVAALVDEIKAQGFDAKVIWCSENGISAGKQPQYTEVFDIPPGYGMATNVQKVKK